MSKNNPDSKTRTTIHPRFPPEIKAVRSYLATNPETSLAIYQKPVETGCSVSVKRHIWTRPHTVNRVLQFCFTFYETSRKSGRFPSMHQRAVILEVANHAVRIAIDPSLRFPQAIVSHP